MILVYQILTGKVRIEPSRLFTLALADQGTRGHSLKIGKPAANKVVHQNFFSVRGPNLWNSLPEEVISTASTNEFKNKLDNHWKEAMFKTRVET